MSNEPETHQTAFQMEILVGSVLLAGVWICVGLLTAGLLWHAFRAGQPPLDYHLPGSNLFDFWKADIRELKALAFRPQLLVNLGIGVLLITPYLRVLASTIYFGVIERNAKYTLLTGFVLAVLTYSLFLR
jgi:uncharacterized membrane protein